MRNVWELLNWSTAFLEKQEVPFPRFCAEEMLAHVLQQRRLDLLLKWDTPLEGTALDLYLQLIQRRGRREPLGYLLKRTEFLTCPLLLSPRVFIPRYETEILASLALPEIPNQPKTLWDLCTGSGCLGIAVKKHRPQIQAVLSDVSRHALACAEANAEKNGLDVMCVQSDLLSHFQGEKADFIFCNPPYVSEKEYSYLEEEIYFEPKEALVAKENGLEFYHRLALDLPSVLMEGGRVFLEIGQGQAKAIRQIFDQNHWKQKRCVKDWAGKDRFFFLSFS